MCLGRSKSRLVITKHILDEQMGSQGKKEASNTFVVPIITSFPTDKICTMLRIHQSFGITTFSIWHKKINFFLHQVRHQPRLKGGQTCEALAGALTATLHSVVGGHHPWKIKFICWLFQKFFFPNLWLIIMPSKVLPKLSKYEILKTDTLMVFSCWLGKSNFKIFNLIFF